ncbi:MAG: periplasmic heavy metal sensor [Limimaricola sp.]|uniref:periplasmic heavy metal sensor n=1 Tax=Limimaricola sp. TaxID=2211665 RepID=UPI001DD1C8C8|nr:periplasmic heavy metal sensor [Limimaricola sp.]MBI1416274.1 periplasmic heavy metal sensor [Limimaricola sp.]
MAESTQAAPVRRWVQIVLVVSLALNLLVAGAIGGRLLAGRGPGPFGGFDLTLGPLSQALDRADRDAIRASLRQRPELRPLMRSERQAAIQSLIDALRADPFDPGAVSALFAAQRDRATAAMQAGQEALLARITAMSPTARVAFAARLQEQMRHGPQGPEGPPPG